MENRSLWSKDRSSSDVFYNWRSRHDQSTCPLSTSWQHPHLLGTLCWAPPALTSLRDQVLQIGNWIVVQKLFISSQHLTEVFSLCSELDSIAHYCFHIQGGRPQGGARCLYTPETSLFFQAWSKYFHSNHNLSYPAIRVDIRVEEIWFEPKTMLLYFLRLTRLVLIPRTLINTYFIFGGLRG